LQLELPILGFAPGWHALGVVLERENAGIGRSFNGISQLTLIPEHFGNELGLALCRLEEFHIDPAFS